MGAILEEPERLATITSRHLQVDFQETRDPTWGAQEQLAPRARRRELHLLARLTFVRSFQRNAINQCAFVFRGASGNFFRIAELGREGIEPHGQALTLGPFLC
jgi:hypothetical protein